MGDSSRRRYQRFAFRYRISVRLGGQGSGVQLEGITKNVSVGGILLESSTPVPRGSAVSFAIVAQTEMAIHPIEFIGEGKVVRVEADPKTAGYSIALKCIEPIQFHPFERRDKAIQPGITTN
jgi:hypothetical protein